MKRLIYLLMLILLPTLVYASYTINNTLVQSVGLNTSIDITHQLILDQLVIAPASIKFENVSHSSAAAASKYNITFNITVSNKNYSNADLPRIVNTSKSIQIITSIDGFTNASFKIYGFNCTDRVFNYTSANATYNREYLTTDYNCTNSVATFQVNLEKGVNILGYEYVKYFALIDEINNAPLNLNNVTSAKLYYDDNRTLFDFKTANVTTTTFTSLEMNKAHLELVYSDGTVITRWLDVDLLRTELRICANPEGTTHYEQIITSSSVKPILLMNTYSRCYIAADYTRFAYQNTKTVKAFSVAKTYQLTTYDKYGNQVELANVDGSIASYINIDTLEFYENANELSLSTETIVSEKTDTGEVTLYYKNQDENNEVLTISIIRTDTSAVVYNNSAFEDANEATIVYNLATLSDITNQTLFRVNVRAEKEDGSVSTLSRYFDSEGDAGGISAPLIAIVSIILLLFGLSFTVTQSSFGWFGVFMQIINLAILTFAIKEWYIQFLMAINAIVLIFIVLVLVAKNKATIG